MFTPVQLNWDVETEVDVEISLVGLPGEAYTAMGCSSSDLGRLRE
jgi:hypothetical protein